MAKTAPCWVHAQGLVGIEKHTHHPPEPSWDRVRTHVTIPTVWMSEWDSGRRGILSDPHSLQEAGSRPTSVSQCQVGSLRSAPAAATEVLGACLDMLQCQIRWHRSGQPHALHFAYVEVLSALQRRIMEQERTSALTKAIITLPRTCRALGGFTSAFTHGIPFDQHSSPVRQLGWQLLSSSDKEENHGVASKISHGMSVASWPPSSPSSFLTGSNIRTGIR